MIPFDESQVVAFLADVSASFGEAHRDMDLQSLVFPARMQFDAVTMGYQAARFKHLRELRLALGLRVPPPSQPPSSFHVGPGPLSADRAKEVVLATSREFPHLIQVFGSEQEATDAAKELLERTIFHLQLAGFQAGKQRNPGGPISGDKVTITIDGSVRVFDIYSLGSANRATTVQFLEITGANPVEFAGLPD
jgi:hypothetical protein